MNDERLQNFKKYLASDQRKNVILDTDAYNEVDDQFCIAYLMKRSERIRLLSINAAPFFNSRSTGPADGMERSYLEILKIQRLIDPNSTVPVYRGSPAFMKDRSTPVASDACDNLIKTVTESEEHVTIIAIGAITNVASALLKCPQIAERASLIWLGGHALHLDGVGKDVEFNLRGDIAAAQVVFDSGIDMVQVPCNGVCSEVRTTPSELTQYLRGKNAVCDYLTDIVVDACKNKYAGSRVIWDVTAASILLAKDSFEMEERACPVICDEGHYTLDPNRHPYLYVSRLHRDRVFADLFKTLTDEL